MFILLKHKNQQQTDYMSHLAILNLLSMQISRLTYHINNSAELNLHSYFFFFFGGVFYCVSGCFIIFLVNLKFDAIQWNHVAFIYHLDPLMPSLCYSNSLLIIGSN